MSARFAHNAVSRLCHRLLEKPLSNSYCCRKISKLSAACAVMSRKQRHNVPDPMVGSMWLHTDIDEALHEIVFSDKKDKQLHDEDASVKNLKMTLQKLEEMPRHAVFEEQLAQCQSLKDIVEHLHQESDNVTGHMAAMTLLQIHKLSSEDHKNRDELTFFTVETLKDKLLNIVGGKFDTVDNDTLISLIEKTALNGERSNLLKKMAKRIKTTDFSLEQLLKLFHSMSTKDCSSLDESQIVEMFKHAEEDKDNYILYEISKQVFAKCWWKLDVKEMVAIVNVLQNQILPSDPGMVSLIANWFSQLHVQLSDSHLFSIISGLQKLRHRSKAFNEFLTKYVATCGTQTNTDILMVILQYMGTLGVYLPGVLETAADHFLKYGHTYTNRQLVIILSKFGNMNYSPQKGNQFFNKVEDLLLNKFLDFEADDILHILCSLIYIKRYPMQLFHLLYNSVFLSKIEAIEPHSKMQRAKMRFLQIDTTFDVLNFEKFGRHFIEPWKRSSKIGQSTNEYYSSHLLSKLMFSLLGRPHEYYTINWNAHSIRVFTMTLFLDNEGEVLHISDKDIATRRLTLLWIPESGHFMDSIKYRGIYAWRKWILEKMDQDVLLVSSRILKDRMDQIAQTDKYGSTEVAQEAAFKSLLSDYIWMV